MGRKKWKETLADKSELRKTWGGVFDNSTILNVVKLINEGKLLTLDAVVKEGKESKVLAGRGRGGRPVAIKIYAVYASNFRRMQTYLAGDPRFKGLKGNKAAIVNAWARKEFKNLERAGGAGVNCPEPVAVRGNVLVAGFIGEWLTPAPRLIDAGIENNKTPVQELGGQFAKELFEQVLFQMRLLWNKANLVHGDLSEYNILVFESKAWLIDFSQAVTREHPMADEFFERDVRNVVRYFNKLGLGLDENIVKEEARKPF